MDKIMNTKIWLIIIAVMHTFMGVIVSYQQFGNVVSHFSGYWA